MSPRPPPALPPQTREAFARKLVAWHLEELNGLGDQLRHLAAEGKRHGEEARALRARQAQTVEALRWNRDEVLRLTWELMPALDEFPEDAYGPAVLLLGLGEDPSRVCAWLEGLPPAAQQALVDADGAPLDAIRAGRPR